LSEIRGRELHFLSVYVQGQVFVNAGACPLNITPCATVEAAKDLRIIHDVASLFPEATFLTEHSAFSYCGFPALDNYGQVVAVTCLLDDRHHVFTEEDQALLRIVGQRIGLEIERKRLDTQKEASLAALQASEQQSRLILDNAGDGIIILDDNGCIEGFNRAAQDMFGYDDLEILGHLAKPLFCESQESSMDQGFTLLLKMAQRDARSPPTEILAYRKDHSSFPVELSIGSAQLPERRIFTLIVRDVTVRHHLEQKLSQTLSVFDNTSEGIVITDAQNHIIAVNDALCRMSGYAKEELIGQSPSIWKSGRHDKHFFRVLWASLKTSGQWQGEIWNRRKNGEAIPVLENINVVRNQEGDISNYVAIMTDITGIKQFEERLYRLAHHDPLTGLANRILLEERWNFAMHQCNRHRSFLAILFIDLDRFKNINDSFGHSVGDQILQAVAERIVSGIRDTDTIARLGGDEFVVLLGELNTPEIAGITANKLLALLSEPTLVDEREFIITPSIGIAIFPSDARTFNDLLKQADTAMYHAKKRGRNNYQFYSSTLGAQVYQNLIIESALRSAVEKGELSLHYQPQFEAITGRLVGAESLLRWHHHELGSMSPAQFIPLAEESGLIIMLGEWVMRTACRQMRLWLDQGYKLDRVAVNVSALQLQRGNFAESVALILKQLGLSPHHLELEVTESFIIEAEQSIPVLESLRQMGVELAIDDFGTSYSSLKYLKLLPIQRLKIDQSFITDIPDDTNSKAIARAVIALANSLQLKVVAEGVENERQRDFLLNEGCDCVQGYFFGKPVPASDFEQLFLSTVNL